MPKNPPSNIMRGRKCLYCGSYKTYRLSDGRVKCKECNKYYSLKKARIDLMVLHYFCLELTAKKAAQLLDINYKSVHKRYALFREKIEEKTRRIPHSDDYVVSSLKSSEYDSRLIFGILARDGQVHTTIIPDSFAKTLIPQTEEISKDPAMFYTDDFKSYKNLLGNSKNRSTTKRIGSFWSFAKERLQKYHGIRKDNYYLYLKEMEFRFNHRDSDLFEHLFDIIYR